MGAVTGPIDDQGPFGRDSDRRRDGIRARGGPAAHHGVGIDAAQADQVDEIHDVGQVASAGAQLRIGVPTDPAGQATGGGCGKAPSPDGLDSLGSTRAVETRQARTIDGHDVRAR